MFDGALHSTREGRLIGTAVTKALSADDNDRLADLADATQTSRT